MHAAPLRLHGGTRAVQSLGASAAPLAVKTIGLKGLPGTHHWLINDKHETLLFAHNITTVPGAPSVHVGVMDHFWMESGRGPTGRYICDNMIIR